MYVVYADGQIGMFKVVSPTDTIRLRFEKTVPAVPGSARWPNQSAPGGSGPGGTGFNGLSWLRTDYVEAVDSFFAEQEVRGTVEVGPLTVVSYGGHPSSCASCHN